MAAHIKEYTGTAAFAALESSSLKFKGTVIAKTGNGAVINLRKTADAGNGVALAAGTVIPNFGPVDLSTLSIKGDTLVLQLIGETDTGWR